MKAGGNGMTQPMPTRKFRSKFERRLEMEKTIGTDMSLKDLVIEEHGNGRKKCL